MVEQISVLEYDLEMNGSKLRQYLQKRANEQPAVLAKERAAIIISRSGTCFTRCFRYAPRCVVRS